jgi:hypothetical protein
MRKVVSQYYDEQEYKCFDAVCEMMTDRVELFDGYAYDVRGSMASGIYWTNALNSGVNDLMSKFAIGLCVYNGTGNMPTLASIHENTRLYTHGDDGIMSVSDEWKPYVNYFTMKEAFATFGMIITPGNKDAQERDFEHPSEAPFLSRYFVNFDGRVVGALKKESILQCLDYYRYFEEQHLIELCSHTLNEACVWEREFYDDLARHWREVFRDGGVKGVVVPTYGDMRTDLKARLGWLTVTSNYSDKVQGASSEALPAGFPAILGQTSSRESSPTSILHQLPQLQGNIKMPPAQYTITCGCPQAESFTHVDLFHVHQRKKDCKGAVLTANNQERFIQYVGGGMSEFNVHAHFDDLKEHRKYVQEAYDELWGSPLQLKHDLSKETSMLEITGYTLCFQHSIKGIFWERALKHHYQENPHHPEHFWNPEEEMLDEHIKEQIADFVACERRRDGKLDCKTAVEQSRAWLKQPQQTSRWTPGLIKRIEDLMSQAFVAKPPNESTDYKCPYCPMVTSSCLTLAKHVASSHPKRTCPYCQLKQCRDDCWTRAWWRCTTCGTSWQAEGKARNHAKNAHGPTPAPVEVDFPPPLHPTLHVSMVGTRPGTPGEFQAKVGDTVVRCLYPRGYLQTDGGTGRPQLQSKNDSKCEHDWVITYCPICGCAVEKICGKCGTNAGNSPCDCSRYSMEITKDTYCGFCGHQGHHWSSCVIGEPDQQMAMHGAGTRIETDITSPHIIDTANDGGEAIVIGPQGIPDMMARTDAFPRTLVECMYQFTNVASLNVTASLAEGAIVASFKYSDLSTCNLATQTYGSLHKWIYGPWAYKIKVYGTGTYTGSLIMGWVPDVQAFVAGAGGVAALQLYGHTEEIAYNSTSKMMVSVNNANNIMQARPINDTAPAPGIVVMVYVPFLNTIGDGSGTITMKVEHRLVEGAGFTHVEPNLLGGVAFGNQISRALPGPTPLSAILPQVSGTTQLTIGVDGNHKFRPSNIWTEVALDNWDGTEFENGMLPAPGLPVQNTSVSSALPFQVNMTDDTLQMTLFRGLMVTPGARASNSHAPMIPTPIPGTDPEYTGYALVQCLNKAACYTYYQCTDPTNGLTVFPSTGLARMILQSTQMWQQSLPANIANRTVTGLATTDTTGQMNLVDGTKRLYINDFPIGNTAAGQTQCLNGISQIERTFVRFLQAIGGNNDVLFDLYYGGAPLGQAIYRPSDDQMFVVVGATYAGFAFSVQDITVQNFKVQSIRTNPNPINAGVFTKTAAQTPTAVMQAAAVSAQMMAGMLAANLASDQASGILGRQHTTRAQKRHQEYMRENMAVAHGYGMEAQRNEFNFEANQNHKQRSFAAGIMASQNANLAYQKNHGLAVSSEAYHAYDPPLNSRNSELDAGMTTKASKAQPTAAPRSSMRQKEKSLLPPNQALNPFNARAPGNLDRAAQGRNPITRPYRNAQDVSYRPVAWQTSSEAAKPDGGDRQYFRFNESQNDHDRVQALKDPKYVHSSAGRELTEAQVHQEDLPGGALPVGVPRDYPEEEEDDPIVINHLDETATSI